MVWILSKGSHIEQKEDRAKCGTLRNFAGEGGTAFEKNSVSWTERLLARQVGLEPDQGYYTDTDTARTAVYYDPQCQKQLLSLKAPGSQGVLHQRLAANLWLWLTAFSLLWAGLKPDWNFLYMSLWTRKDWSWIYTTHSRTLDRNGWEICLKNNTESHKWELCSLSCCPPGRYAMQAMKQMEPQVKQAIQSFPKSVRTCFFCLFFF